MSVGVVAPVVSSCKPLLLGALTNVITTGPYAPVPPGCVKIRPELPEVAVRLFTVSVPLQTKLDNVVAPAVKAPVIVAVVLTAKAPVMVAPALALRRSPMVLLVRVWVPVRVADVAERAERLPAFLEIAERRVSAEVMVPVVAE